MSKLLDSYYGRPVLWDIIIAIGVCTGMHLLRSPLSFLHLPSEVNLLGMISDIISTSISLAGFVLAALTIVITFKDNIAHKEAAMDARQKEQLSSLELLFSSKHYAGIVRVYSWATLMLIGLFVIGIMVKLLQSQIPLQALFYTTIALLVILALTVLRSLYVLYRIIKLQT